MNSFEILNLTQLGKLFQILKSHLIQCLDIFASWEDSVYIFTTASRFQLVGNLLTGPSPPLSGPIFPFDRAP
jgi:hypothetical protein